MNANGTPAPDPYDAFLSRLDAATKTLSLRAASLDKAMAAVVLLRGPYESVLGKWERRRRYVSGRLARHSGSPQSYTTLGELHGLAVAMESTLRGRIQRLTDKLSVLQDRREAIDKALLELELSRVKLTTSRLLARDRAKLGRILSALAGSPVAGPAVPDTGLMSDLQDARRAVILAEALMEVKGR